MKPPKTVLLCEREGSANLYIKLLAEEYKKAGLEVIYDPHNFFFSNFEPSFVHIQWPESLYIKNNGIPQNESIFGLIKERLLWFKKKQIPLVYTVHNLRPHDVANDHDAGIFALILKFSDVIVHHGKKSIEMIKAAYPECSEKKHVVCPHGPYPVNCAEPINARKSLGIPSDKIVLLNFGAQRAYKGGTFTLRVFSKLKKSKFFLLTAGKMRPPRIPDTDMGKIKAWLKLKKDILLLQCDSLISKNKKNICKSLTEKEVAEAFAGSDIVFLGHQTGLNSGVLALAASYQKPIVYPELGNFTEQLKNWNWGISYEPGSINSAARAIKLMCKKIDCNNNIQNFDNLTWLEEVSWKKHVEIILKSLNS